jgi:protease I
MTEVSNAKIAILATDGFEKSELFEPLKRFRDAGATVHVVSPESGEIRSWDKTDWGDSIGVDTSVGEAKAEDYDALILPGGQINPDILRTEPEAVEFVRAFGAANKPIAAICHGPWMLIEADLVRGKRATSYHSIQTDMRNAGADWVDEAAVVDGNLITSRNPGDIPAFCDTLAEKLSGEKLQAAE